MACGKPTRLVDYWDDLMKDFELLNPDDVDVNLAYPDGLLRAVEQQLLDLTPWHLMDRETAKKRLSGLRERYERKYVPFALRQDSDDMACIDPAIPEHVVIVHDFASEGYERRQEFTSFWDWFRAAIEDMISFE